MTLVTTDLSVSLAAYQKSGSNAFGEQHWNGAMALVQAFTSGTTVDKIDQLYMAEHTIASASNLDLDLAGGLTDVFGATITAAELVGICIINKSKAGVANTTNLTIGAGSNPVVGYLGGTTPTIGPLRPGAILLLMSPDAAGLCSITASTGDILRIANSSGASATIQVALLLRSS